MTNSGEVIQQDTDETWVPFEAIVTTSHRTEKYGGVRLSDDVLNDIVAALNSGQMPMICQHDWTQPVRVKDVEANLVGLDDGERGVRLLCLVHPDDRDLVAQFHGMSFSASEPIGRADGPHPDLPPLNLSADAGWFDDDTIANASSIMSALAPVDGSRLFQFSAFDDARIILELGYNFVISAGPGLATNAIWDGIKYLLLHRMKREIANPPSRIEFRTDLNRGEVIGIIDTSDIAVVAEALGKYADVVKSIVDAGPEKHVRIWSVDDPDGSWNVPPGQ